MTEPLTRIAPLVIALHVVLWNPWPAQASGTEPSNVAQALLAGFDQFAVVTLPEDCPRFDVAHGPLQGRIDMSFEGRVADEVQRELANRLQEAGVVDRAVWRGDEELAIDLNSMTARLEVFERVDRRKALVIGEKRTLPPAPVLLFGENCGRLLVGGSKGTDLPEHIEVFCRPDSSVQELLKARPDPGSHQATDVWRLLLLHKRRSVHEVPVSSFTSYLNRYQISRRTEFVARISAAMLYMLRNSFDRCFEQIEAIDQMSAGDKPALPQWPRLLTEDLAEAAFERMVGALLSAVQGGETSAATLLAKFERYREWRGARLPARLVMPVAQMYRHTLFPERAIALYRPLLERSDVDQFEVLDRLATTYLEAGQRYRAFATAEYMREHFPDRTPTVSTASDAGQP